MRTEGSGASRAGTEDFLNEDAFLVEQGLGLYVVCDGVGGTPAGELAAQIASDALDEFVERAGEELDLRAGGVARAVVEKAMVYAMTAVADAERADPELRGLATTVTMLLAHGNLGVIGHRGDSRAYLIRRNYAHQLTVDHELTEVTSGEDALDEIDVFALPLQPGDTVVLCTDGAEQVVLDASIVLGAGDVTPRILARRIVDAAHRIAPDQDATAVVVRVRRDREPGWLELSLPARATFFGHTLQPA